jgi:hypothetical protein
VPVGEPLLLVELSTLGRTPQPNQAASPTPPSADVPPSLPFIGLRWHKSSSALGNRQISLTLHHQISCFNCFPNFRASFKASMPYFTPFAMAFFMPNFFLGDLFYIIP